MLEMGTKFNLKGDRYTFKGNNSDMEKFTFRLTGELVFS